MMSTHQTSRLATLSFALALFASGAAALTYQFCWNRYLYAAIGIDLDSTSVIVATFMLGLGLGNALGARLARQDFGIKAFVVIELALFVFGALSPWLLDHFTHFVLSFSRATAASALFVVLLIPTLLMGATLPLMTAAATKVPALRGINFSALYLYNTLGGAAGAFVSAFLLIAWLGLSKTILAAALTNLCAALLCVLTIVSARRNFTVTVQPINRVDVDTTPAGHGLPRALWFSAFAGLLALSIEIVWIRLFGLSFHQTPWVMPFVLGCYLLGLALGVAIYRHSVAKSNNSEVAKRWVAYSFLCSGVIDVIGGLGFLALAPSGVSKVQLGFVLIVLSAASKGAILTAIADLPAESSSNPGAWAGRVMAANIAGATLGPLLVCYVLFEYLGFQQVLCVVAGLSLGCGLWAMQQAKNVWHKHLVWVTPLLCTCVLIPQDLIKRILDHGGFGREAIAEVVESRHGIFHRLRDTRGDVILGANLYDGRFNVDPATNDLNGIARIYRSLASAPKVERVLMIGLGSGSWLEVARHFEDVKHIQVVELAPAYGKLMRGSELVAGALTDPKVHIAYTDGLRWLHRHSDQKFDVIVMNTTFYWRAFATNLLSVEFFQQLRGHLSERGVVMMNPTGSKDAAATFLHVFPNAANNAGMLLAPYQAPTDVVDQRVRRFRAMGELGQRLSAKHGAALFSEMASVPFDAIDASGGQLITKDNLRSEFAVYRPFSAPHFDGE
jgi:predicted membrane-bound spermidine synthase